MWGKIRTAVTRNSNKDLDQSPYLAVPTTRDQDTSFRETRRSSIRSAVSSYGVQGLLNANAPRARQRSKDRRADPLGLTVLFTPKCSPVADIIFVHGLGGTSYQTWSKNQDPELFWPQNWLPLEPGICTARISTFGYNAHFSSTGPNSVSSISDFAKSLLFEMKYGKDNLSKDLGIGRAPIIFVVHSMGGLIFKKAYINGLHNGDYKELASQFRAVLFLSTPHRGANLADILNRILAVSVFSHSPKQYLAELNKNSPAMEDLNEVFRDLAPRLQIFSFYETLQTTMTGPISMMILDKTSSILGYPGEKSQPLNANHHDVCKFTSQEDPSYKSIRSVLQTLISKYLESRTPCSRIGHLADTQKIESILAVPDGSHDDYTSLRDCWRPGTCEWMLTNPTFVKWMQRPFVSSILWAHAHPGSGKSILSSFLINDLKESGFHCNFFFFKHGDTTKRSPNSLLRFLAFQVAQEIPEFHNAVCSLCDDGLRLEKAEARTIWQKLFEAVLFKLELDTPLFWVIDALDESDSVNKVIEMLSTVTSSKTPVRVIVLSRFTPAISTAFERMGSTPVNILCADSNVEDIRLYATTELDYMHGTDQTRQLVANQIVERAEGNFLWAHLALKEILQCHSQQDIERALEEIPSGMTPLYQRMEATISQLGRASDKLMAKTILTWATYSRRPLNADELMRALQPEFSAVLDLRYTINQVCGHFVILDSNNRITLVHQTARDYLKEASNLPFSLAAQHGQEELFSKALLIYLDRQMRSLLSQKALPPFYAYAATSWAYHLRHSSAGSDDALDLLIKFFEGPYVLPWIQALAILRELRVLIFTAESLNLFIKKRRKIDAMRIPLLHRLSDLDLLENWATDLLKLVGKFGTHLLQDSTAIYKYIPQFCPRNSVLYRQFGKYFSSLSVSGLTNDDWDDCLARVSVGTEAQASMVLCSGRYFAVLTSVGTITLWDSLTFQEVRNFEHNEHIFTMCFSSNGSELASYGFITTRIWNVSSGRQLHTVLNPVDSRAICMSFAEGDQALLMGSYIREIRKLPLDHAANGWQIFDPPMMQEDTILEGAFLNSPSAMAFDDNATQVAVAYRGSPLTVWSLLNSRVVNRCKRRITHGKNSNNSWSGVTQVIWHPYTGEVLGIYDDGAVFKWHPFEETHLELKAGRGGAPSVIKCSYDGKIFGTCDVNGAVKIYNFHHFVLIYQLSSEAIVTTLCFSPDSKRFYDLRGSYCNVWEPNALLKLADNDEKASEVETERGSMTMSYLASESWAETLIPVTALSARRQGELICIGNDEGVVKVYNITIEKKQEIRRSTTGFGIDHLTWAEDGEHLAYAEIGGKLVVQSIELITQEDSESKLDALSLMEVDSKPEAGAIHQLLLSPDLSFLIVAYSDFTQLWSIPTGSIETVSASINRQLLCKWAVHPSNPKIVLAFTPTTITAFNWRNLEKLDQWKITPSMIFVGEQAEQERPDLPRKQSLGNAAGPLKSGEVVSRAIVTQAKGYIMLVTARQDLYGKTRSQLQIINVESLSEASTERTKTIESIAIPKDIADIIEKPLDILEEDRLVFLDESYWVCTWRLGHKGGMGGLIRHFFLPRDWVNAETLELCQVLADGTFLCPKKGEVAIIKSTLESGW